MEETADSLLVSFLKQLPLASEKVLLLDYDGTLAPFRVERHEAVPYDGVRESLDKILATNNTRVIIVSGRTIDDLLPLLGFKTIPEIWGCHGFERLMPDGSIEKELLSGACSSGLEMAYNWIIKEGFQEYCERKPCSIAFHVRGLTEEKKHFFLRSVGNNWSSLTEDRNLAIHSFDGGLELRVPNVNKGKVVEQIIAETPPEASIAYLGDDLTDEDAFMALKNRGLSVLVREHYRETFADCWLVPPVELLDFLNNWYSLARNDKENT
jgi:trehalose-phosphatase